MAEQTDTMTFDVIIVGAGPAGLSAACRLMQKAQEHKKTLSVCVLEKGAEVGAHIVSGALLEPTALNELFPHWQNMNAPITTAVNDEQLFYLHNKNSATQIPLILQPKTLNNHGNYIISLASFCRWLKSQAENLGVDIFSGYCAHSLILENNIVKGVATGAQGLDNNGNPTENFVPGIRLLAKQTIFAEGARGHLGKQLIELFNLDQHADPQHFGLGIKEIWQLSSGRHQQGSVIHTLGWPLTETKTDGGGFLYHLDDQQVSVGLITDLNYKNPYVSPFDEFQRFKHHPVIASILKDGNRIAYGARAIAKGGPQSLPNLAFPGGMLAGCNAGTLNFAKIKGIHTAMKSGMLAAEAIIQDITEQEKNNASSPATNLTLNHYQENFKSSWAWQELYQQRNIAPYIKHFGLLVGGFCTWLDLSCLKGKTPWTLHHKKTDYQSLEAAAYCQPVNYPKPDGVLSFDKLSSVFLTNLHHRDQQPSHLILKDVNVPLRKNLPEFQEPAQRYCPAGVYEITAGEIGGKQFIINAQNCIHCKTCDIKDPAQNITWVTPEGGSGPNYPNM